MENSEKKSDYISGGGQPLISIRGLVKEYQPSERVKVAALNGVNLDVFPGEFISVTGHSGSGKSTLLHLIGLLDKPTSGEIFIQGRNTTLLTEKETTKFRLSSLSFIFQFFNLLENYTSLENISFQLQLQGYQKSDAKEKAMRILQFLGLEAKANLFPKELSGGEQQRIAIGRALAKDSLLVLADEPTAHLDSRNAAIVMELFLKINRDYGKTILLVTHESEEANQANRSIVMKDGKIISEGMAEKRVLMI